MARPKANPEQHMAAYHLYRNGLGQTAIYGKLAEEFENPVSERTIATWIKGFKTLPAETVSLDSPFQWHLLDQYGLPWEASAFLLEICTAYREREIFHLVEFVPMPLPTVRQARWWWRVHLAAPDVPMKDLFELAQRFVSREQAHDVLDAPLELADLEAHLAYKPWKGWPEDKENFERYHRAVVVERIPPLKNPNEILQNALAVGESTRNVLDTLLSMGTGIILPEHPALLLSQRLTLELQNWSAKHNTETSQSEGVADERQHPPTI